LQQYSSSQTNYRWIERYQPPRTAFGRKVYLVIKRGFDLSFLVITSMIWLPLMLVIPLIIKLSEPSAPVFYRQLRTGKDGKRFKMIKFRTMVPDAETRKQEIAHLNELHWPDFKIRNDPRITTMGRWLRKTSLDELPQVFNILIGDMSMVGPRPTSFGPEQYELWHTERLDVQPGLTGLWQIVGRASSEFDERLRLDIAYIEHRCLGLDFEILLRTVTSILQQRGAV